MKFSTTGLIIKQQNIGEQDRLVTVLSENGVLRAFVRRAKNIKSPKCASTAFVLFQASYIRTQKFIQHKRSRVYRNVHRIEKKHRKHLACAVFLRIMHSSLSKRERIKRIFAPYAQLFISAF